MNPVDGAAAFETVWSVNEAFRDIQIARDLGQEPAEELKRFFAQNVGCFAVAQEIVIQMVSREFSEVESDALLAPVYDALAESERGEDAETIVLRALYKLEDYQQAEVVTPKVSNAAIQETDVPNQVPDDSDNTALFERVRSGEPEAFTEIVERYGRFAKHLARKAVRRLNQRASAIDYNDLEQEAMLALLHAAELYVPGGATSFLAYAAKGIHWRMVSHVDDMSSTVRLPRNIRQKTRRLEIANWHRRQAKRPLLSAEEIAEICDVHPGEYWDSHSEITVGTLRHAILISDNMGSLDNGFSPQNDVSPGNDYVLDETQALESITTEPERSVEDQASIADLPRIFKEVLDGFSDVERDVIVYRFGFDGYSGARTLDEVAESLGLTRERIRKIETQTLNKLRHPVLSERLSGLVD